MDRLSNKTASSSILAAGSPTFACKSKLGEGTITVDFKVIEFSTPASEKRLTLSLLDIVGVEKKDANKEILLKTTMIDHTFSNFKDLDGAYSAIIAIRYITKMKNDSNNEFSWDSFLSSKDKVIVEDAVKDVEINCGGIDVFFDSFWSGHAKTPVSSYQTTVIKDKDIKITPWEESDDGTCIERTITYLHPNDAPMGPSMAPSTKQQKFVSYGDYGMVMFTSTSVRDVPKTDCFVLKDKIVIKPNASGKGVVFNAMIGIDFVKSTMFKRMIEGNAKKGIKKWLNGYSEFLSKNI